MNIQHVELVEQSPIHCMVIPYSAKFSRRIIFAFFADWSGTTKIRRREKGVSKSVANRISLIREIRFCEMLQITRSAKWCASKIWRYTVVKVLCTQLTESDDECREAIMAGSASLPQHTHSLTLST